MKDTITARTGYRVIPVTNIITGEKAYRIDDGNNPLFIAQKRSHDDYKYNIANNEAAIVCEIFTTIHGNQFIYWRDNETDEDFITRVG